MHRPYGTTHLFSWMERTERQDVSDEITQVYVELSTHCNLACRTCVRHSIENFRPRHFSRALMRRLVPMLKGLPELRRIVLLGFGEALCNPDFTFHLTALRKTGAEIVLVTNAHFIDAEIAGFLAALPVDELWLSWDDDPAAAPRNRRGADAGSFSGKVSLVREARERAGSSRFLLGMEIVAMKSNFRALPSIVNFGTAAGIERFIVSNVFPYTEVMQDEILYTLTGRPERVTASALKGISRAANVTVAGMSSDVTRRCPFIERGTVFITAEGDIAPCPELAYTHPAWYFGSRRTHGKLHFGAITRASLASIWNSREFRDFRNNFAYFDFPDCSLCREPDMCWHRTVQNRDCYGNSAPCGECLWAKGIVLCP